MMKKNPLPLAALAIASALLGACVVPPGYPYYEQPVRYAPPPLRQEYPGYPPEADYVWLSGYWGWAGGRYEWVPGRWEAPRQGHVWVPPRWEHDGEHWRQSGGRWEADAGRPRPAPPIEVQTDHRREEYRDAPPRYEQHNAGRPVEAAPSPYQERAPGPHPEAARPAPAGAPHDEHGRGDGKGEHPHEHDRESR